MKAARIEDGVLAVRDIPVPDVGPGQALVHMASAGVCHSDLHVVRGDWTGIVGSGSLGHEGIGVVEALGPGADEFVAVGDRVILGLGGAGGGGWCGACEYCLGGRPRLCARARPLTGTLAEYLPAFAAGLVVLPDAIGNLEVPLACGGLTAYGAVKRLVDHHVMPGRSVAIIGAAGGLGHYAVQIASNFGYEVIGIDVGTERLRFVESLGASLTVSADEALETVTRDLGGVDACLVFSARMAGFELALSLLRKGGLFVGVALPASNEGNIEISPMDFFRRDLTLVYSAVGNVQEIREVVALAGAGKVRTHVGREGALSELGSIFDELQASAYLGRAVVTDLVG